MPQDQTPRRPPRYRTFLLSLWAEAESAPNWRCSLENPHTGERKGFKSVEELATFLQEWITQQSAENQAF